MCHAATVFTGGMFVIFFQTRYGRYDFPTTNDRYYFTCTVLNLSDN